MALSANEFARREDGSVESIPNAVRLNWPLSALTTADLHLLHGRFSLSAKLAENPTDRKMFVEIFLGSKPVVTLSELAGHFAQAVNQAAVRTAKEESAEAWIAGGCRQKMIDALHKAAAETAFACGLEVFPPFDLELTSPSLNEKRLEETTRARAEERTRGQVAHLQRAGEVFAQFESMRRKTPGLPPGVLLEQLSPSDRGGVLQALLAEGAQQGDRPQLWGVAGPSLLRIDARTASPKIETILLPDQLGPLRSVQAAELHGRRMLLVGARSGIMLVDPDQPENATLYSDPSIQSELGFNRVILHSERIWGSHGEAGLVAWQAEQSQANPIARIAIDQKLPIPLSTSPSSGARSANFAPRHFQAIDDEYAVYAIGGTIKLLHDTTPLDLPASNTSEIIAIIPDSNRLLIVRRDGSIDALDRATRQLSGHLPRAGTTVAAAAIPWLGTVRLLLATEDGRVDCIGFDDSCIMRYTSRPGVRIITACADQIAAVSSDRQRLIVWHPWETLPAAEIHVTATAKHRLADIEFG